MVWYAHLFQNFPQFIVIHKGFGIVNKAEIYVFLELSCFFDDPTLKDTLFCCLPSCFTSHSSASSVSDVFDVYSPTAPFFPS